MVQATHEVELMVMRDEIDVALRWWGKESQVIIFAEELGEVISAASHWWRGRLQSHELAGEIADARIVLDQLERMASCSVLARAEERSKRSRLRARLLSEIRSALIARRVPSGGEETWDTVVPLLEGGPEEQCYVVSVPTGCVKQFRDFCVEQGWVVGERLL